ILDGCLMSRPRQDPHGVLACANAELSLTQRIAYRGLTFAPHPLQRRLAIDPCVIAFRIEPRDRLSNRGHIWFGLYCRAAGRCVTCSRCLIAHPCDAIDSSSAALGPL